MIDKCNNVLTKHMSDLIKTNITEQDMKHRNEKINEDIENEGKKKSVENTERAKECVKSRQKQNDKDDITGDVAIENMLPVDDNEISSVNNIAKNVKTKHKRKKRNNKKSKKNNENLENIDDIYDNCFE